MWDQFFTEIAKIVYPAAVSVVAAACTWLCVAIKQHIERSIKTKNIRNALFHLDATIQTVIAEMEQTVRPMLSDGKLSKEEAQKIKEMAIERVKAILDKNAKEILMAMVDDFSGLIGSKIEKEIHEEKKWRSA